VSGTATTLLSLLGVLGIALAVRLLVRNRDRVAFASALVAVGVAVSALGLTVDLALTAELILMVLLPTIVFQGTTTLDVRRLVDNVGLIIVLTGIGLPLAIVLLGAVWTATVGVPLLVSLVFAAIVLPTDPAAVLSIFDELDVDERLAITIEGESLLNDGVAIVIFSTLLAAHQAGRSVDSLATAGGLIGIVGEIAVVGGGGLLVGAAVGYTAHALMRRLDDEMSVLLLTVLVAYGSFLVAEHVLGLSGILAVVGAGLLMGAHEETHHRMSSTEYHVQELWTTGSFLVTTILYVLIGTTVPLGAFVRHADLVLAGAVFVVIVRAATVYPLVSASNRLLDRHVSRACQHVMVWGGLHTVVPIALVLSLPASFPFREELQVTVFGVAIVSIVVQGLLMPVVLSLVGLGSE
jgi:CPA1 family monovalent cation:H+ antiporter